jgi:tripartite-type tricarboxylate transporter receptor subunit TctC
VTLGHTGAGAAWHLSAASLGVAHDAEFNYIPFDGGAPTRAALLGGHVTLAATGIDEVKDLYEAGQVDILAVNAETRHPAFPKVPTLAEAGYKIDAPVLDWRGLALPKGVPADRVAFLEEGFNKMFNDPEFRELAKQKGLILVYKDSDGFESFLANMEKVLQPTLDTVGLLK